MGVKLSSKSVRALLALVVLLAVGIAGAELRDKLFSVEGAPDQTCTWPAPTSGAEVHHYIAEVLINRTEIKVHDNLTTNSLTIPAKYGTDYMVRVAAVSSEGVRGPWSKWSVPRMIEVDSPGF